MSGDDTLSFARSAEMLREELEKGRKQPGTPKALNMGDYRFADRVFQPRTFEGDAWASEEHKKELYEALLRGDRLPPILVWWGGKHWYVIDGHHRAVAYNRVRQASLEGKLKNPKVPPCMSEGVAVEVFEGTLNQAIRKAAELNSRTKLPMSKRDKLETGWKLVSLEDDTLSKASIASAAGVAERTIATMRSTLAELRAANPAVNPADLRWEDAKRGLRSNEPEHDEWEQRQAMKWAKAMGRAFGGQPGRIPHVFAMAIELYAEKLPPKLVEFWKDMDSTDF